VLEGRAKTAGRRKARSMGRFLERDRNGTVKGEGGLRAEPGNMSSKEGDLATETF